MLAHSNLVARKRQEGRVAQRIDDAISGSDKKVNKLYMTKTKITYHLDSLVQDCSNSTVNALELRQSYTKQLVQRFVVSFTLADQLKQH